MKLRYLWFSLVSILLAATTIYSVYTPPVQAITFEESKVYSGDSSDGWLRQVNPTYNTAWAATTAYSFTDSSLGARLGQYEWAGDYYIYRVALFFDTSNIPDDATVTDVTLSVYVSNYGTGQGLYNVTIQNGQPTYPHDPIVTGDYWKDNYSGNGGTKNTTDIVSTGYWNVTMTATSWINVNGMTKLFLRNSNDIAGTSPAGNEWVDWYFTENGGSTAPKLYITYQTEASNYILYGAYDEDGYRDGAINVTLYKEGESPETFELDGVENITTDTMPIAFHFDLGYNESRVYYIKDDFEEIYVFKATDPFYTYYFSVTDLVGLSNAYLESLINVNGTDRIVERWDLEIVKSDIPLSLSWGRGYKIRIIADEGTHNFGTFMAEATQNFELVVTHEMFPETETHIGEISIAVSRPTYEEIQISYTDGDNQTTWLYLAIYEELQTTELVSHNETSSPWSYTYNWYDAGRYQHYRVAVAISHTQRGSLSWSYTLEGESLGFVKENPWDLEWLGTLPFAVNQLVGLAVCLLVFGSFTQENAHVGMVVSVLVAMAFTAIGWLQIPWAWLVLTLSIAIIAGLSMVRKRSEAVL